MSRVLLVLVVALTLCGLAVGTLPIKAADAPAGVAYPKDYLTWTKVTKLSVVAPADRMAKLFAGVHNVYANPAALEAMKAGKPYPDGSILVLDLYDAADKGGKPIEGAHKGVFVMHKDAKANPLTGGWGFEQFKADAKDKGTVTDAKKQCYSCHATKKKTDGTYTTIKP